MKHFWLQSQKGFIINKVGIVILGTGVILALLFGIIQASKNTSNKTKDTSIAQSANSIMKAIQVDTLNAEDYSDYTGLNAVTETDCMTYVPKSNTKDLQESCKFILRYNQNTGCDKNTACLWIGTLGAPYPKLSIMAWLPNAKKYYCIGSNGSSSTTKKGTWSSSGCAQDPSGR